MRLPQIFIESRWFQFANQNELLTSLDGRVELAELEEINRLGLLGLPPITSTITLATMFGINAGLVWSFVHRTHKHYRTFQIPKGRHVRLITAPRVALKVIQKWFSYHVEVATQINPHVYGFVRGRSHIDAALMHEDARWCFSVDIRNFFQTTPQALVEEAFRELGYNPASAKLIASLTCLNGYLAQGSPCSPAISNLCFSHMDINLVKISDQYGLRLTRYADDITFSGRGAIPDTLRDDVLELFRDSPWKLADDKERLQPIKGRIKVHGLIVDGRRVRMTKGYRNKIRAYRHVLLRNGPAVNNEAQLRGHVQYARHVERRIQEFYGEVVIDDPVLDKRLEKPIARVEQVNEPLIRAEPKSMSDIGRQGRSLTQRLWSWVTGS